MSLNDILSAIDAEIARVEQARNLLTGPVAKRGRKPATKTANKQKRAFSAATRTAMAEAQRKRWAAVREAAK